MSHMDMRGSLTTEHELNSVLLTVGPTSVGRPVAKQATGSHFVALTRTLSASETTDSAHWGATCPRQGSSLPPNRFAHTA